MEKESNKDQQGQGNLAFEKKAISKKQKIKSAFHTMMMSLFIVIGLLALYLWLATVYRQNKNILQLQSKQRLTVVNYDE